MGPFDRFNDRAKRVLALAQDEAIRFNHNYIGAEHLLLGLVREGEGVASGVLQSLGVKLETVRHHVIAALGREAGGPAPGPSVTTRMYAASPLDRLDDGAKRVLALAQNEAFGFGHSW